MGMLHTQLFTQKQYQPQYISIRPLVKLIAVVNINLFLRTEVKLHFVTKDSPVNQIIFEYVFSNTYLTTVSKYGRTNDITNSR